MDALPKDDIFQFKEDTLTFVRKEYNLDKPGAMKQAVDILEEWIKKQNHFTKKDFDREYLERVIINAKGSIERAKERLDRLFTLRTLMPKYFTHNDARTDFQNIEGILTHVFLPKSTNKHERVYMCHAKGNKFSSDLYLEVYRFVVLLAHYYIGHDYTISSHIIFDFRDASIPELMANINLIEYRELVTIVIEGFGLRVKGIYIITESKFLDSVVKLAKSVVGEKISKRIHCLKDLDGLLEYVPKNVLPKDYGGGDERTLEEIRAQWYKIFSTEAYREYNKVMNSARTDESLRMTDHFNDQYMGMAGTFKTLSVD